MDDGEHPKLEKALSGLAKEEIFVPPEVDERMREAAVAHFGAKKHAKPQAIRRAPKRSQKWLPLAASIGIAAAILYFSRPTELQKTDLNHDGVIDVVDALLMAEQIAHGRGRDMNGDGRVDARDAAEIAMRAVRLDGGGS